MSHNLEEKKLYLPIEEKDSEHNYLTRSVYGETDAYEYAWKEVSNRAFRYALHNVVNDEWFSNELDGDVHDSLGIALRIFHINTSRGWVSSYISLCNLHWNGLLNKYNNALVRVMKSYSVARGRESIQNLFVRGFSADSMCSVIKEALTYVFDARRPDASTPAEILATLEHDDRDDIYCGGAHACFSIADNDTNVCWKPRSLYDDYLCHFFRTALHHALAFLKHYMPYQKYYVSENMVMEEVKNADLHYNKVMIAFGIEAHPAGHNESSDEDDDSEPETEAKRDRVDCKITDTVIEVSNDEQLEAIVRNVMPLLSISQLEVLAASAMRCINELSDHEAALEERERAAEIESTITRARNRGMRKRRVADITPRPFFSTMSFSSSEEEEGDEDEEEGE
jgi:hypothetical protein